MALRCKLSAQFEFSSFKFWRYSPDFPTFDDNNLPAYVDDNFYDHLCAATKGFFSARNISDDHPAVEIIYDLETKAYCVDENSSEYYILKRYIIQAILRWLNILNCRLKVGAPYILWFHFSDAS